MKRYNYQSAENVIFLLIISYKFDLRIAEIYYDDKR